LLKADYLGCGSFGADSASSVADHASTYTFGVDNYATLTPDRTSKLAGYLEMEK
jgi:hypothetical protein